MGAFNKTKTSLTVYQLDGIHYQSVGMRMISDETELESRHASKTRFLDAALHVFGAKGCSAASIVFFR
jgi:hypothetical protein